MSYGEQIKVLRTGVQTMTNQAKSLYADLETKGDKATADERVKLENLIADGTTKRKALDQLIELEANDQAVNQPESKGRVTALAIASSEPRKSWGNTVIESKEFKENNGREMKAVPVHESKVVITLNEGSSGAGGALFRPDRLPDIFDIARQQAPTILDLVNNAQTTSNAVEYVRLTARQNLAATVAELTDPAGATKPQGDLTFDVVTAAVRTIAEYVVATRQLLQDAPRLSDTIDSELIYQVKRVLEDNIVNGTGSGSTFTGILATSGIQVRTMHATTPVGRGQVVGDTKATTLRRAITDIRLAFYEPSAIALAPADSEAMELTEYAANRYMLSFDPVSMKVWRVPVVETQALAAGTAIVGSWKIGATLWDRMQAEVRVSENVGNQFIQNLITILCELRAAFGVIRPLAFEKVTLI